MKINFAVFSVAIYIFGMVISAVIGTYCMHMIIQYRGWEFIPAMYASAYMLVIELPRRLRREWSVI